MCRYFEIGPLAEDKMSFEDFLFLAMTANLFNRVEPLQPGFFFDRILAHFNPEVILAKEQVSAQSDLRFGKRCQKLIFKMAAVVATFYFLSAHLAILCIISTLMLIIKFRFNWIIKEMSKI